VCEVHSGIIMAATTARRDLAPNQTIYLKNLNEKSRKSDLKRALYALFSQFGPILDVVALKTPKMRGQAFVVFRDIIAATNAMRDMQNFVFFDKPMLIQYAKGKSDAIAKLDGTFQAKENREKEPRKRKAEDSPEDEPAARRPEPASTAVSSAPVARPVQENFHIPPNRVLFLQNLPEEASQGMLVPLFQQFPGFVEVRLIPGKKGIGFVEFQNEMQSAVALAELQGFKLTTENAMNISFQKQL